MTASPAAIPDPRPTGDAPALRMVAAEPTATYTIDAERTLADHVDRVTRLLGDRDRLAGLDTDQLRSRIQLLQRLEGATTAALATTITALDTAGGVEEDGSPSASEWLRREACRSGRDATRLVRLGKALDGLPKTAAALAEGRIGRESADAIVAAARGGALGSSEDIDTLADIAERSSPEELRRHIRQTSQAAEGDSLLRDERRQHQRRRVSLAKRPDGMWDMHGLLPGEVGEAASTLLDVFDRPDRLDTPEQDRRRPDQRLADAFEQAVNVALDHADLPTAKGQSRPHISAIVDIDTLDADLTDPDDPNRPVAPDHPVWKSMPAAGTGWGTVLSPQAARRMCCDAAVSRVVTAGESRILDVGRTTRVWNPAQRTAIAVRDGGCRGCGRPIGWCQIHHLQWWRHGGSTDLDNGIAVCHRCHRRIHDLGWHARLDPTTAEVTWTSPTGTRSFVTHPRRTG